MTKKPKHTIPPRLKVFPVCDTCQYMTWQWHFSLCGKHNVQVEGWYGCADYAPRKTELLTVCTTARAKSVMPIAPVTE